MPDQSPIMQQIASLRQPNCGACSMGHTPFCYVCKDRLQHEQDINKQIVDEVINLPWPSCIINGHNIYERLEDLIKIKRSQGGN